MPQPKFQLYKHIKNQPQVALPPSIDLLQREVKPHVVVVGGQEEKQGEGSYCIPYKNSWIEAGTDPLEAQRMRSKLVDQTEYTAVQPAAMTKGTSLAQAPERYFNS